MIISSPRPVSDHCSMSTKRYTSLESKYKVQWAERYVGFIHSVAIVSLVTPIFLYDEVLGGNRVFGASEYASKIYAFATGYFLWDTLICLRNLTKDPGALPFVAHGLICFTIYLFAFRPYLQFYASVFLIFESSTPVLHAIWVIDHFKLNVPTVRLLLGILLLLVYFFIRILFSVYWTYHFALDTVAGADHIPLLFHVIYATANVALTGLNFYWFSLILGRVIRHFSGKPEKGGSAKKKDH